MPTHARVARDYICLLVFWLTYVVTVRSYFSVRGAAGEEVEGKSVGMCQQPVWRGTLRKRSGRTLLTGASMRLFDTSSDKRPPYYLPIVVSSSLSSSAMAMAAASPCRERFPLIDFWNFPFTYAE